MKENYYLDDGAYSAVRCVIEMVRQAKAGGSRDVQVPRQSNICVIVVLNHLQITIPQRSSMHFMSSDGAPSLRRRLPRRARVNVIFLMMIP